MDTKRATMDRLAKVLAPFDLHDLGDVLERLYLDEGDALADMPEASVLRQARDALLVPLGGEDGFGDLSWRVGPHRLGLPRLLVELHHDGADHVFTTAGPLNPWQVSRDFLANQEGDDAIVSDYIEQQDRADRADIWRAMAEDCRDATACQQEAARIEQSARLPMLLRDAIARNHGEAVEDALELGADANEPDASGNRPLHQAVMAEHHQLLTPLIHSGAQVNGKNAQGLTPLHMAASQHFARGCLVLLAHGADAGLIDGMGRTAADCGRRRPRQAEHAAGL